MCHQPVGVLDFWVSFVNFPFSNKNIKILYNSTWKKNLVSIYLKKKNVIYLLFVCFACRYFLLDLHLGLFFQIINSWFFLRRKNVTHLPASFYYVVSCIGISKMAVKRKNSCPFTTVMHGCPKFIPLRAVLRFAASIRLCCHYPDNLFSISFSREYIGIQESCSK